jgi:hypothetical protein
MFFSISTLSKLKLILNHALISLHIIEKKFFWQRALLYYKTFKMIEINAFKYSKKSIVNSPKIVLSAIMGVEVILIKN